MVVTTVDFNAQVSTLKDDESRLGGSFFLGSNCTDNRETRLQICASYGLYLQSTNFHHKGGQRATRRSAIGGGPVYKTTDQTGSLTLTSIMLF